MSKSITMRQRNFQVFEGLPPEITMDILTRLPALTLYACKCVCKPWLDLLKTDEFIKSHLAKAVPGLAVNDPESCKIFEFVDDALDLEEHEHHYMELMEFDCHDYGVIQGSANGMLFLCQRSLDSSEHDLLYIFNPMGCDYIQVQGCEDFIHKDNKVVSYGFGASRVTGQLKVVRVSHDLIKHRKTEKLQRISKSECQVYTLGTGSWRSTAPGPLLEYYYNSFGALLYGNLHWLAFDLNGRAWISCYDVEEERFSLLSAPSGLPGHKKIMLGLYAMEDCLSLSDGVYDKFVIWLLKDYGGEKSWTKAFVIRKTEIPNFRLPNYHIVNPIKIFKDGDVLMAWGGLPFFYYSAKGESYHHAALVEMYIGIDPILHTSSLISLKSFANEKVYSALDD